MIALVWIYVTRLKSALSSSNLLLHRFWIINDALTSCISRGRTQMKILNSNKPVLSFLVRLAIDLPFALKEWSKTLSETWKVKTKSYRCIAPAPSSRWEHNCVTRDISDYFLWHVISWTPLCNAWHPGLHCATRDILDFIVQRVTSLLSLWHVTSLAIFCDMWHIWLFLVTSLWFWSFFCDTRSKCVQIVIASAVLFDTHLRRSNQQLFTKMGVNNCLSIYYTEIK